MNELLIAARAVHFASTAVFAGGLFFSLLIAPVHAASFHTVQRRLTQAALGLALLSGAGWLALTTADISGRGADILVRPDILAMALMQTTFGWALTARFITGVALLLLLAGRADDTRGGRLLCSALCVTFIASLAWSGHAAATEEDGALHRAADALHAIAACAWIGGLVPLGLFLRAALHDNDAGAAADATRRFGTLGLACVLVLIATGAVNTWFLVGTLPALLGTTAGKVLLAKIALFTAMLALAAYNRRRLTPRIIRAANALPMRRAAILQLTRVCTVEAAIGFGVLGLVAWLGTLPPGLHEEPAWPLPFRFVSAAYFDADLRTRTVLATLVVALGLATIFAAPLLRRRAALIGALAGIAAVAFGARDLGVLTTEAFPTTFQSPAAPFAASEIVQGHALFASYCAACHGADGKGNGPQAASLAVAPADLTADHIYGHTDGDLFWRLSVGLGETMPAFGAVLDEAARWRLVHALHANADAERLARLRGRVTFAAFSAPRFALACPDGASRTPDDFKGRSVHVIVAGEASRSRLAQLATLARDESFVPLVVTRDLRFAGGFCATDDADTLAVLARYRRASPQDLEGTEFLIDADWRLRAMWHAGLAIDWIDPTIFRRQIAAMDNPQVLPGNLAVLDPASGDTPFKYFPGADDGHAYHSHRH